MAYHDLILSESGLQHYYRCNEGSGSTLADSKGSETLTISGTNTLSTLGSISGSASTAFDTTGGTTGTARAGVCLREISRRPNPRSVRRTPCYRRRSPRPSCS